MMIDVATVGEAFAEVIFVPDPGTLSTQQATAITNQSMALLPAP